MTNCEHKTSITIFEFEEWQIHQCEWGCGQYIVTRDGENGITEMVAVVSDIPDGLPEELYFLYLASLCLDGVAS